MTSNASSTGAKLHNPTRIHTYRRTSIVFDPELRLPRGEEAQRPNERNTTPYRVRRNQKADKLKP